MSLYKHVVVALTMCVVCFAGAEGSFLGAAGRPNSTGAVNASSAGFAADAAGPQSVAQAAVAGGQCTAADEATMATFGGGNADGTFPKIVADCGRNAYFWFSFSRSSMHRCIVGRIHISSPCADCFADAGVGTYGSCKLQCLFGSWCAGPCLRCAGRYNDRTKGCTGIAVPEVTEC